MMDKPLSFYAFEMLYWCGIREGELLALTPADFDFDRRTVTINKPFSVSVAGTSSRRRKRKRQPHNYDADASSGREMQDYMKQQYDIGKNDRMFAVTKSYLIGKWTRC